MRNRIALTLIVITYLIVGTLFAIHTPEWQAPDEPAHYNYIRQLANGTFPVIEPDDWDQEYQAKVVSSRFDPEYSVASFEYEDYQPPLYYLVATPVYGLFDGEIRAIRLLSLLFGAGVIAFTYFSATRLFPRRGWMALAAAAFIAFLPQHVAMLASVNNDSLAELLIAGILFLLISLAKGGKETNDGIILEEATSDPVIRGQASVIRYINSDTKRHLVLIGVLLGLGFITKVTVYIMAPVVAMTLLWLYWGHRRLFVKACLTLFIPAFVIGLIWWIRNIVVYDQLDPLGTQAHNAVVIGQPQTADWINDRGLPATLRYFGQTLFQSFWGQFGWMGVVMPSWVYQLLALFSLVTVAGFLWAITGKRYSRELLDIKEDIAPSSNGSLVIAILAGTLGMSMLVLLVYNFTFVQAQGRYLFPALVPISIAVALAWWALLWPFIRRKPDLGYLLPLAFTIGLVSLDLLALYRYIVPALT